MEKVKSVSGNLGNGPKTFCKNEGVRYSVVRPTAKAQSKGRLACFQVETGKKDVLSNPLSLIVTETDKRVNLEPCFVYFLACDWLASI